MGVARLGVSLKLEDSSLQNFLFKPSMTRDPQKMAVNVMSGIFNFYVA